MVQKVNSDLEVNKPAYMYYLMSKSGQCSPTSDTLDSGTGSDLETTPTTNLKCNSFTLPTSLSLTKAVSKSMQKFSDLSLNLPNAQRRLNVNSSNDSYSTDSEESESSLSCDSLNSNEIMRLKNGAVTTIRTTPFGSTISEGTVFTSDQNNVTKINFLPRSLLRDIRDHSMTISKNQSHLEHQNDGDTDQCNDAYRNANKIIIVKSHLKCNSKSASYSNEPYKLNNHQHDTNTNNHFGYLYGKVGKSMDHPLWRNMKKCENTSIYENDKYISFHLNECVDNGASASDRDSMDKIKDDDSFAGYRDVCSSSMASTIRSSKGTIRGVKNRVRNGIATFLQMQQTNIKVSLNDLTVTISTLLPPPDTKLELLNMSIFTVLLVV